MTLETSIMLCSHHTADDGWDYISAHPQPFIWSDDEDPVATWNRQLGEILGAVNKEAIPGREDSQQLAFRDRTVEVRWEYNRDDRFRLLHALARVARPEADLRLCRGSTHSSDVAFLAMPSADWNSLESQLGRDTVGLHFLSMDSSFDAFMEAAFAMPDGPPGGLAPDLTDWDGGASYQPGKLDYQIVSDGPGQPRLEVLRALVRQYLEAGTVTVTFWQTPSKQYVDRDDLVEHIASRLGATQIRVANSACTGFLVVEENGVAAGWRTDGWQPAVEASAPASAKWWQFWRRRA